MYDLYSLLHGLYKTTDELRNMRAKHQKFTDMYISIDTESIAANTGAIREIEARHIAAITAAYETLPPYLYEDVRDTVLKYAHRDEVCGCCFENVREQKREGVVKLMYTSSNIDEYKLDRCHKGCKQDVLERIRDEHYAVRELKRHRSEDIDEYIKKSRADRVQYINESLYERPYLEPYNICLFWNVEYSKSPIRQVLTEIQSIKWRLDMAYTAYKSGRSWGHY
jgi:hypothetical protein